MPSTKSKKKQEVKTAIEPQLQAPTTEGKWEVEISKNRESTTGKNKGNEAVTSSNVVGDDDDDDLFKGKTISSEKQVILLNSTLQGSLLRKIMASGKADCLHVNVRYLHY